MSQSWCHRQEAAVGLHSLGWFHSTILFLSRGTSVCPSPEKELQIGRRRSRTAPNAALSSALGAAPGFPRSQEVKGPHRCWVKKAAPQSVPRPLTGPENMTPSQVRDEELSRVCSLSRSYNSSKWIPCQLGQEQGKRNGTQEAPGTRLSIVHTWCLNCLRRVALTRALLCRKRKLRLRGVLCEGQRG